MKKIQRLHGHIEEELRGRKGEQQNFGRKVLSSAEILKVSKVKVVNIIKRMIIYTNRVK